MIFVIFVIFDKIKIKMMKKIIVLITYMILLVTVNSLKSSDICHKGFECDGKHCSLSNCTGLLNYDCDKFICSLDAQTCDHFDTMLNEFNSKRNSKLAKAETESLMKGISFASSFLSYNTSNIFFSWFSAYTFMSSFKFFDYSMIEEFAFKIIF